jgi:hypothetical protein
MKIRTIHDGIAFSDVTAPKPAHPEMRTAKIGIFPIGFSDIHLSWIEDPQHDCMND